MVTNEGLGEGGGWRLINKVQIMPVIVESDYGVYGVVASSSLLGSELF